MWAGIAGAPVNSNSEYEVALSIHDSVYNTDFSSSLLKYNANDSVKQADEIEDHVIAAIRKFSQEHACKFLGAGVTMAILRDVRADLLFILRAGSPSEGAGIATHHIISVSEIARAYDVPFVYHAQGSPHDPLDGLPPLDRIIKFQYSYVTALYTIGGRHAYFTSRLSSHT